MAGSYAYGWKDLDNVIVAGNSAGADGGGVYGILGANLDFTTVTGNSAGGFGGGVMSPEPLSAWNSIVAGNTGPGGLYSGTTVYSHFTCFWDNQTSHVLGSPDPIGTDGNFEADPEFLDVTSPTAADWDLHVATSSPTIDGSPDYLTDPDGTLGNLGAYGGPLAGEWDLDGDGWFGWWLPDPYSTATSPDLDCDDTDATVYPGSGC